MTQATWSKPVRARHAHVSQALAEILEGLPKAAIALANHLFRICIAGKPEEIELYNLGIGQNRKSDKWGGKQYAKNTLRAALKILEDLKVVQIIKDYGRGVFKLTVNHPGGSRPFEHSPRYGSKKLPDRTKELPTNPKTEQPDTSNTDSFVPLNRELAESTEEQATFSGEASPEKLAPECEKVIEKYEDKLKECGIYRKHRPEKDLVANPKFAPVLKAISSVPPERAERGIKTFIRQARSRVYDYPYFALADAIMKGWD